MQCDSNNGFAAGSPLCALCQKCDGSSVGCVDQVRDGAGCSLCRETLSLVLFAVLSCLVFSGFVSRKAHKARVEVNIEHIHVKNMKITRAAVQRIFISHVGTMSSLGGLTVRSAEILQVMVCTIHPFLPPVS